jgi:hypothetical protein
MGLLVMLILIMSLIWIRGCLSKIIFSSLLVMLLAKKISLHVIALSTTTTEYMYISKAYKEAIWSRGLYNKLLRDYILHYYIL